MLSKQQVYFKILSQQQLELFLVDEVYHDMAIIHDEPGIFDEADEMFFIQTLIIPIIIM
jgi:hypothetical protein